MRVVVPLLSRERKLDDLHRMVEPWDMRKAYSTEPDLPVDTPGIVLDSHLLGVNDLIPVFIGNDRYAIWDHMLEVVSKFPGKEDGP